MSPKIWIEGEVDAWNADGLSPDPLIGGKSVFGVFEKAGIDYGYRAPRQRVRVTLGIDPEKQAQREGTFHSYEGFAGTDVTPPEPPEIQVGGWDVMERLRELDGRQVALLVEVL